MVPAWLAQPCRDGRSGDPGLTGKIQEGIGAWPGEEPGQMFLVLGQNVDRERAGPADPYCVELAAFRHVTIIGGSSDRDATALSVIPRRSP
jgi:hypothetical protein